MAQYVITFPARTMVLDDEEFKQAGIDANAVVDEMKAAGVFVAAGGINPELPVELVAADGSVTPGPYPHTEGFNGGVTVVESTHGSRRCTGHPRSRPRAAALKSSASSSRPAG